MQSPNTNHILSASLGEALRNSATAGSPATALPPNDIIEVTIQNALEAQSPLSHPYHNRKHVEHVIRRSREFAALTQLNAEDQTVLILAASFHDYGHCGVGYRQLCTNAPRNDLSNEEYAALCADEALTGAFSPQMRLAVQGAILATSYAQHDKNVLPRPDLYRPYTPLSAVEKLLALADVATFLDGADAIIEDTRNIKKERHPQQPIQNTEELLRTMRDFLDYVQTKIESCAQIFPADYYSKLLRSLNEVRNVIAH